MITKFFQIACLLLAGHLGAACDFSQPLSISELVGIALENNPETSKAWWNAKKAASSLGVSKSSYYPNIYLQAGGSHGRDFKFINGPDVNYTRVNADVILSYMLYDSGERKAEVQAANMALQAANWQKDSTLQRIMVSVMENAYATLHAQEALKASIQSLDEANTVFGAAKELNRTGLTPISDIYSSQASLSQMQIEVADRKAQLDIQRGKLAISLGIDADTPIKLAPVDKPVAPQQEQICDLINLAKKQRADLMSRQARLSASIARQDAARAGYGPKISVRANGGTEHYFHDKSNGANYNISLNLEFPLFDGFKNTYQNRAAYADTQISAQELSQLELDISLEVLTAARQLEAAIEMISYADDNLQSSLKAYEGILEKYRAGRERITDISAAQLQLNSARLRFSDMKTKYLVSLANLAYATGTLAPYMESPCD